MHTGAYARRHWTALAAAVLFVFQALIASVAQEGEGAKGAATLLCTASGPRVLTLDTDGDVGQNVSQHGGAVPHCCFAGCVMQGGVPPPGPLPLLAWRLSTAPRALPAGTVDIHFSSARARRPQQSRAPPRRA